MSDESRAVAVRTNGAVDVYEPETTKSLWISMGEKGMSPEHARVLAIVGKHYDLDPAAGEISVMGGKVYVTLEGYLTLAERHSQYNGSTIEPATPDERKAIKCGDDEHAWVATVYRKDRPHPIKGYGVASERSVSMPQMHKFLRDVAQSRAMRRACRLTFRLNVPDRDFIAGEEEVEVMTAHLPPPQTVETSAGFLPPVAQPAWDSFWAQVANYGLTESEVHTLLGVQSMKDYAGTLDWARQVIDSHVKQRDQPRVDPDENRGRSLDEMRAEYRGLMEKANVLGKPIEVGRQAWDRVELADRLAKARQHVAGLELQIEFAGMASQ